MNQPSPPNLQVLTVSGSPLTVYGRQELKVTFDWKDYNWSFITEDVTMALLGVDFLTGHNLLVDVAEKQLVIKATQNSPPQKPSAYPTAKAASHSKTPPSKMKEFLQEYEDVFKHDFKHDLKKPAKHKIHHHIETEGPSIHSRFRCLALEKLTYAKKVFKEMEEA
ncbi:uncharacterized protein [Macrobrachium rosenbergii]|uniref:uncharacterized protein n=1 Tax=Macrobrachium rosenbergii TaxID=79674 RepID=UPI0034D5D8C3